VGDLHEILDFDDVKKEFRLEESAARKLYRERGLKYSKIGKKIIFLRRWLVEFVEENATQNASKAEIGSRVDEMIKRAKEKEGGG
jgi:hypothetical protein